jgi:cytochrome c-L
VKQESVLKNLSLKVRVAMLVCASVMAVGIAKAELDFRGTISGDPLDFTGLDEVETPTVKHFKETGENKYTGDKEVAKAGFVIFSTACAGCHGHLAEGKLGPALSDDYWTYPKNETDKGLFETIYGGANGMMGPQRGLLTQDEILRVISFLRSFKDGKTDAAH